MRICFLNLTICHRKLTQFFSLSIHQMRIGQIGNIDLIFFLISVLNCQLNYTILINFIYYDLSLNNAKKNSNEIGTNDQVSIGTNTLGTSGQITRIKRSSDNMYSTELSPG